MATIKDIAKKAGVSCGTVSNVLNKKGNVRADKIKAVQDAINHLGYSINESAKTLRQKHRHAIGLLVPDMRSRHYINLYESVNTCMQAYDYTVEIYSTSNLFQHEKMVIQKMVSANVNCIVTFPTYINSSEIYDRIPLSIYLVIIGPRPRDVSRPYLSVSFDYESIGKDIAAHVLRKGYKSAAVLIDSVRFSETFAMTIKNRLEKAGVLVQMYGSTPRNAVVRAFDFLGQPERFDVIITSNLLRARAVRQTYLLFGPDTMPEIVTLSSSNTIFEDEYTCVHLDYTQLGMLLAESLIRALVNQKPVDGSLVLSTQGLNKRVLSIPRFPKSRQLKILASEGYCSRALQKLLQQFTTKTGVDVSLSLYPNSDFERVAERISQTGNCDLLISDINHYKSASETLYMRKEANPTLWRDLRAEIDPYSTYFPDVGRNNLCFSFNAACQMLFYRNDLFGNQSVRRVFYESSYHDLDVPKNIRDYDEIAHFFSRALNPLSPLIYGATQSSMNADCFFDELYWRLSVSSFHPLEEGGALHFNSEKMSGAIREYFRSLSASNAASPQLSCYATEDFIRGNGIMSVFSTASAPIFTENEYGAISDCIKSYDVPGKKPIVNCNVIGIAYSCDIVNEAAAFLRWVFHDSISNILTLLSGQPILQSVTTNAEVLSIYPWLKYFNQSIKAGKILSEALTPLLYDRAFRSELVMALTNSYIKLDTLPDSLNQIEALFEKLNANSKNE